MKPQFERGGVFVRPASAANADPVLARQRDFGADLSPIRNSRERSERDYVDRPGEIGHNPWPHDAQYD